MARLRAVHPSLWLNSTPYLAEPQVILRSFLASSERTSYWRVVNLEACALLKVNHSLRSRVRCKKAHKIAMLLDYFGTIYIMMRRYVTGHWPGAPRLCYTGRKT